jgi:chromosome segregation ATPase
MTLGDVGQLVGALAGVGGFIGGFVALVKLKHEKRKLSVDAQKSGAEAVQVLSAAAVGLVGPWQAAARELEADLTKAHRHIRVLQAELESAQAEVQTLRTQVSLLTKELDSRRGADGHF